MMRFTPPGQSAEIENGWTGRDACALQSAADEQPPRSRKLQQRSGSDSPLLPANPRGRKPPVPTKARQMRTPDTEPSFAQSASLLDVALKVKTLFGL
jgi:hypothetical protein